MSGTRSQVREFSDLLDGARVDEATEAELVALLRSVGHLESLAGALNEQTTLTEDVRARQRARLMAVAHVQAQHADAAPAPAAPGARLWQPRTTRARRWSIGLAGTLAGVVALSGVGIAASRSLPGQPFYEVKRATEAVQLAVPRSDTSEGNLRLAIAQTRLREVEGLVQGDDSLSLGSSHSVSGSGIVALGASSTAASRASLIRSTLQDMDSQTRKGTALLTKVARSEQDTDPLWKLWSFADDQQKRLQELLPTLPESEQALAVGSISVVADVKVDMQGILVDEFHTTLPPSVTNPGGTNPGDAGTGPGSTGGGPGTDDSDSGGGGGDPGGTTPGDDPVPTPQPEPSPTELVPPDQGTPTPTDEPPAEPTDPAPTEPAPSDPQSDAPLIQLPAPLVSLIPDPLVSLIPGLLSPPDPDVTGG